jgi:hypothetical protein
MAQDFNYKEGTRAYTNEINTPPLPLFVHLEQRLPVTAVSLNLFKCAFTAAAGTKNAGLQVFPPYLETLKMRV